MNDVTYNQDYYRRLAEGTRRSATRVVPYLMDLLAPTSVLDVGCGSGSWLDVFRTHGVDDVVGVEHSDFPTEALDVAARYLRRADLTGGLDLGRQFDLALSLEVGEHLPEESHKRYVAALCAHAPYVVFSAAVPAQGGDGHIAERWQTYWIGLFATHAYRPLDAVRPVFWDDPEVKAWYKQNTILYVAEPELEAVGRRLPDLPTLWNVRHPNAPVVPNAR